MWYIWLLYVVCLVAVVFVSNRIGGVVDALDKKTKLSGAFLGAVLLAGVTSLPELVTSLTGALINEPDMTLGNILGSNIFDIAITGFLMVIFCRRIVAKGISKSNAIFTAFTLIISAFILVASIFNIRIMIPGINVNVLTLIIIALYIIALFTTRKQETLENENTEIDAKNNYLKFSVKRLIIEFIVCAVALVGVSIAITFLAQNIADTYNLSKGLAGALFLGVATSLPEIVSCFALVRLGNFNASYGNIIGSCMFNFIVISLADIVYTSGTVFITDLQSVILSACLAFATFISLLFCFIRRSKTKLKNSITIQIGSGILIVASYIAFLVLSSTII